MAPAYERLDGIALVVKNHIRRVEVYPHIRAIQLLQKTSQRVRCFLPGLESQVDVLVGKQVGHLPQSVEQLLERGILALMRQEPGVKAHQPHVQFAGEPRALLDALPVLVPGGIQNNPTGAADALHGRVIFAGATEHSGNDL